MTGRAQGNTFQDIVYCSILIKGGRDKNSTWFLRTVFALSRAALCFSVGIFSPLVPLC